MSYSLHPGAEHDVADALNFYKQSAGPVIAARFLEEFERVANFWLHTRTLAAPPFAAVAYITAVIDRVQLYCAMPHKQHITAAP